MSDQEEKKDFSAKTKVRIFMKNGEIIQGIWPNRMAMAQVTKSLTLEDKDSPITFFQLTGGDGTKDDIDGCFGVAIRASEISHFFVSYIENLQILHELGTDEPIVKSEDIS